ncbi:MAG: TetR/AcrR family transcriptional regulator [Nannocystaceae bacterium]|nr:TetR/AcrR family transcriptional regulator [Nannocystaceae bacterium]
MDTVLDAVAVVLARHGPDAVTTNRICEAAGVSIGSLYQYFPDKQAIYRALHQRHVDEVGRVIERALAEREHASLEDFACALTRDLVDVHTADPELHRLVTALVPEGPAGFRAALHETFEQVIPPTDDAKQRMLFVLPNLVESLVHGLTQPLGFISLPSASAEAVRTVRVYLASLRG